MTWFSTNNTFGTSTAVLVAAGGGGAAGTWSSTSGGSLSGGTGGYSGGGNGGSTNGTSPGAGGGGAGLYGGNGGGTSGGTAGTQSSGYAVGQGGVGANSVAVSGPGCSGGNGGGTSGVNGNVCTNGFGQPGPGGGGGGSGYIRGVSGLSSTSTASGIRSGSGYIEIKGLIGPILTLEGLNQYRSDGVTPLGSGSATNDDKVIFGATITSEATSSVQLQVQVQSPNATSTPGFQVDTGGTLPNSLISYYALEDVTDSHGSNDLTNTGSVTFSAGKVNNAVNSGASPTNKYLSINSNLGIINNLVSMSGWAKMSTSITGGSNGQQWEIFNVGNTTHNNDFRVVYQNNAGVERIGFAKQRGGIAEDFQYANVTVGTTWHHIVLTYNGTTLKGYFDNTQVVSFNPAGDGSSGINTFSIMKNTVDNLYQFEGLVDEVAVWGRALTTTEITDLYNNGSGQTMGAGTLYSSSSTFVTPGTLATTSFSGVNGPYHWLARAYDNSTNAYSAWQHFGGYATSTDFIFSPIVFTNPTNGTTTSATTLTNWQVNARTATSTNSYRIKVEWGIASFGEASSTVNTSGTQLTSGINIPKTLYSGDYTEAGIPVAMQALATLTDITGGGSTFIATTTVTFTEQTIPGTSNCEATTIQCISYAYDANGNITKIVENASTSARRVVDYTYDDLNRLITAVGSNVATGGTYSHTYSYNAIGNLLSGPAGTYSYAHASSSYANPHAPLSLTSTSTVTYAYDNSGNLTSRSIGTSTLSAYTWDYRNRMTQSTGGATSTYAYDFMGQRIKLTVGTSTTIYPTGGYNVTGSSTVKQVSAVGILVATIDKATSTAVMRYVLNDHLGSTNIVTDIGGNIVQTLDYYPYGGRRVNAGADISQREFLGQHFDESSQLSYLNARYYDGSRGQFTSQDPVFLAIGNPNQIKNLVNLSQKSLLAEPQKINSYSYAINNPIAMKDPEGKIAVGTCGSGGAGAPGLYAGGGGCGAVSFSLNPFRIEIGSLVNVEGGGSTAVGSINRTWGFMVSNANSFEELEGMDIGGGASLSIEGATGAIDVRTSKHDVAGKRINSITFSAGPGVAFPPVEVHGGPSYTKSPKSFIIGYNIIFGTDGSGNERVGFSRTRHGVAEDFLYSNQTLGTSNYHLVVLTYDGTTLKGYFNNTEVVSAGRSGSGTGGTSGNKFNVMKQLTDSVYQFEGLVDEVGVWTRALNTTEISDLYNSGSGQTMESGYFYSTSSTFVTPGTQATTSFSGAKGSYHWQARAYDSTNNAYSAWQNFGANATSTDFIVSPIMFTYPTNGTTTGQFANWQVNARSVTSTNSYRIKVEWGVNAIGEASSTVNTSGTQLTSGINIPKTLYSGDYTDAGVAVDMVAQVSLYDITATSTFIATSTVRFVEQTIAGTSNCESVAIQCIAYTYDANGNITKIVENASTSARRTIDYTYDDLNRLITASSSGLGSGSSYAHTYSYNAIGNLLSGPAGTYSYAHATSSYANPHAPLSLTSTSTVTYAYDNSGNLTTLSIGTSTFSSYAWDYRNRMAQSSSSATSTYAYDSFGQRIRFTTGTSTTIYPTGGYNVTGSSTVKQVAANGIMVATFDKATSTTLTRYTLTDHLGSTNIVTDNTGTIIQTLDYLPYGAKRISVGTDVSQRELIGQFFDESSQLSYLNARYYDGSRGQFTSQDPVFWEIGQTEDGKKILSNPQWQNSYSYAGGNPITQKDPTGRTPLVLALGTSPEWAPAIYAAGAALLGGTAFYLAKYRDQLRTRPFEAERLIGDLSRFSGSGNNGPRWAGPVVTTLAILGLGYKMYESVTGNTSREDGFIIDRNAINSLPKTNQNNNPQSQQSAKNQGAQTSPTNRSGQSGGAGSSDLQLRLLYLQVQVLQLQLQSMQSTQQFAPNVFMKSTK